MDVQGDAPPEVREAPGAAPLLTVLQPVALLGLALVLLATGDHLLVGEAAGSGSGDAAPATAVLAGLCVALGLLLSLRHPTARRTYGAALLGLAWLVVLLSVVDPGFRFVWGRSEGELWVFVVALVLVALALLTPAHASPGSPAPAAASRAGWVHAVGWLVAFVVVTVAAFRLGTAHFESVHCSRPGFDGECDVAPLEGLVWAAVAAAVVLAAAAADALRRRRR